MKKILPFTLMLTIASCADSPDYKYIGQDIIDGKISAVQAGKTASYRSPAILPKIWVQNATSTQKVEIPFEYEGRWKVGDSCLLIIEKYEIIKKK